MMKLSDIFIKQLSDLLYIHYWIIFLNRKSYIKEPSPQPRNEISICWSFFVLLIMGILAPDPIGARIASSNLQGNLLLKTSLFKDEVSGLLKEGRIPSQKFVTEIDPAHERAFWASYPLVKFGPSLSRD